MRHCMRYISSIAQCIGDPLGIQSECVFEKKKKNLANESIL
jgi:hypothetical protein